MTATNDEIAAFRAERARRAVEAYAECGSMAKAGAKLGVTPQYIAQLIAQHEQITGQKVPRSPPPIQPRVEVHCQRCGKLVGEMTVAAAKNRSGYCRRCTRFMSPQSIPDAQIEVWIAAMKGGASVALLTAAQGWEANESHRIPMAVFTRLQSDGRHEEIVQLWPRGVPAWIINRTWRVPSVRIPHEGIVNGEDKKVR